jgi:hypothetical protein
MSSPCSRYELVASCCECCDGPLGSGIMELVPYALHRAMAGNRPRLHVHRSCSVFKWNSCPLVPHY